LLTFNTDETMGVIGDCSMSQIGESNNKRYVHIKIEQDVHQILGILKAKYNFRSYSQLLAALALTFLKMKGSEDGEVEFWNEALESEGEE
jgi:hypothetical protein